MTRVDVASLPRFLKKLRGFVRENERNFRAALKNLRDQNIIRNYYEEGHGIVWVQYRIEIVPRGGEDGYSRPEIHFRIENNFRIDDECGTAKNISVRLTFLRDVEEWEEVLERQIQMRLKGWRAEERVVRRVQLLVQSHAAGIQAVRPANIREDAEYGVDLFVAIKRNTTHDEIPLQVKSSRAGQKKHEGLHPRIPSIVVHEGTTDTEIEEKVTRTIEAFIKGKIVHC